MSSFAAFPEWVEHISSTEKDLSSDYTMSCIASGKPKPSIHWLKNGELVIFKQKNCNFPIAKQFSFCCKIESSVQPRVVPLAQ